MVTSSLHTRCCPMTAFSVLSYISTTSNANSIDIASFLLLHCPRSSPWMLLIERDEHQQLMLLDKIQCSHVAFFLYNLATFLTFTITCRGNESIFAALICEISSVESDCASLLVLLDLFNLFNLSKFEYELKLNGLGRSWSLCAASTANSLLTGQCECWLLQY